MPAPPFALSALRPHQIVRSHFSSHGQAIDFLFLIKFCWSNYNSDVVWIRGDVKGRRFIGQASKGDCSGVLRFSRSGEVAGRCAPILCAFLHHFENYLMTLMIDLKCNISLHGFPVQVSRRPLGSINNLSRNLWTCLSHSPNKNW